MPSVVLILCCIIWMINTQLGLWRVLDWKSGRRAPNLWRRRRAAEPATSGLGFDSGGLPGVGEAVRSPAWARTNRETRSRLRGRSRGRASATADAESSGEEELGEEKKHEILWSNILEYYCWAMLSTRNIKINLSVCLTYVITKLSWGNRSKRLKICLKVFLKAFA